MTKNDGGPAYPQLYNVEVMTKDGVVHKLPTSLNGGMSLRDLHGKVVGG